MEIRDTSYDSVRRALFAQPVDETDAEFKWVWQFVDQPPVSVVSRDILLAEGEGGESCLYAIIRDVLGRPVALIETFINVAVLIVR